jgi:DNA transformation protein
MRRGKAPGAFATFVVDQLGGLGDLVTKRMFGGMGLYLDGTFFGLVFDDRLYFRVSEHTRGEYKKRKMKPFTFNGKSGSQRYYEVPLEILESPDDLAAWAKAASQS